MGKRKPSKKQQELQRKLGYTMHLKEQLIAASLDVCAMLHEQPDSDEADVIREVVLSLDHGMTVPQQIEFMFRELQKVKLQKIKRGTTDENGS